MHGEIDAPSGQSFFNLLREHALGADLGEGHVGDFVTRRVDDLDFNLMSAGAQKCGDVVRLPECKLGAPRADAEFGQARAAVVGIGHRLMTHRCKNNNGYNAASNSQMKIPAPRSSVGYQGFITRPALGDTRTSLLFA